jgi:CRISPR-associated protein Cas1
MAVCCDVQVTTAIKSRLLTIPTLEVNISGQRSPLMVAASQTTASLARCFAGEARRITYPTL